MFTAALTFLILLFIIIYHVSKRKHGYWKQRRIPYSKPAPFLGNYGPFILQKKCMAKVAQDICQQFPDAPYIGAFYGTEPTLMVQDPEIVKNIMTKDFYYFSSREISNYTHNEVITQNLFFTFGDRWKVIRQNLTPLFSSSKMKNMFYLIDRCAHIFEGMLDEELKIGNVTAVRPLMARFTMDCIGSCAFGIDTGTMAKNGHNNPFTIIGNLIFKETHLAGIKVVTRAIWPALFYGLGIKRYPVATNNFFTKIMKEVFEKRQYKPTNRNDFVDLILNFKKENYITGDSLENMKGGNKKVSLKVDDEILVSQCMLFFAAGFETTSTTLQYTLYELAKHPDAQQKVIKEIDEYLRHHDNKLGYDCLTELPFTEACFDEVLRLYPVLGVLTREVVEDYTLPCGAVLEKNLRIHLPVYHLHHHPDFFANPEEFRPERFYGDEKRNIKPYTYMPFGEGPRICIGMRFAKMQMFSGIVTVLKRYQVDLAEGTPTKLEFTATTAMTQPKELIMLKFIEREGWQNRQFREK